MRASINCDMGESFGIYKMGEDKNIVPYITEANIACGFHASDPNHMHNTVRMAKKHNIKVGAHFSLPDLPGFGRREMQIESAELFNIIIYQIGALKGFLDIYGMKLNHLKPHGALYGMAASNERIASVVADAGIYFDLPIFGMAGTLHESVYLEKKVKFRAEFFVDLDYSDDGSLIITREHKPVSPALAAERALLAASQGIIESIGGIKQTVLVETICVHSDTPNASAVAKAVHDILLKNDLLIK